MSVCKRLFLFAAFFLFGCGAPPASLAEERLRVGLEDYYPPFAYFDENGAHHGFDNDIAAAICENRDWNCEYVIADLPKLVEMLGAGEIDFAVLSMASTEERMRIMDFSDVYYRSRTIYVGDATKVSLDPEQMRGKRIGAQAGTIQATYLQANWGDIADIVLDDFDDILQRLGSGDIDLALLDGLPGYEFLKSPAGLKLDIIGDPLIPDEVMSQARISVRKQAGPLVEEINQALLALTLNGEYNRINRKYFPFSIY